MTIRKFPKIFQNVRLRHRIIFPFKAVKRVYQSQQFEQNLVLISEHIRPYVEMQKLTQQLKI